jgi:hypothetical protein
VFVKTELEKFRQSKDQNTKVQTPNELKFKWENKQKIVSPDINNEIDQIHLY